jgi:8-oxo-dGTP pyrophosphatase MutT (NUDIX family)
LKKATIRYNPSRVARVILIRKKGDVLYVLLVESNKRGEWEFPGGKLKRGETYERAAKRESLEETGIRTQALTFFLVWQHDVISIDGTQTTRTIKRYYMSKTNVKRVRPQSNDVSNARWFALRDTLELPNIKRETRTIIELIALGVEKKSLSIRQITHFDERQNDETPAHQQ